VAKTQVTQLLRASGRHSRAIKRGSTQIWLTVPIKKRSFNFSLNHVKKSRLMIKMTYAGIVRRLVSKVPYPADFRIRVR